MNTITIGSTVTYRCPWTGYWITGIIKGINKIWGEGFFDIENCEDSFTDTAIHTTDIKDIVQRS